MSRDIWKNIFAWFFVIAWMVLIFSFSAEPSSVSSVTSGSFTERMFSFFSSKFRSLSPEEKRVVINASAFIIRKSAHLTVFAVLGVLSYFAFHLILRRPFASALCSILLAVVYAVSDEFHQFFISGRSCELRDVLIDSAGALLGVALSYLVVRFIEKRRDARRTQNRI